MQVVVAFVSAFLALFGLVTLFNGRLLVGFAALAAFGLIRVWSRRQARGEQPKP